MWQRIGLFSSPRSAIGSRQNRHVPSFLATDCWSCPRAAGWVDDSCRCHFLILCSAACHFTRGTLYGCRQMGRGILRSMWCCTREVGWQSLSLAAKMSWNKSNKALSLSRFSAIRSRLLICHTSCTACNISGDTPTVMLLCSEIRALFGDVSLVLFPQVLCAAPFPQ